MSKFSGMSRAVWESFWEVFFPSRCPICGKYVEKKGDWCARCLREAMAVRMLAIMLDSALAEVWAMGKYKDILQRPIKNLKYRKSMSVLPYLKSFLEGAEPELPWLKEEDWLAVPVPLFADKEKTRGFNQTELIFKDWLQEKGIPMERGLIRTRETRAMYGLSPAERQENLRGAFEAVMLEGKPLVQGRKVLLLDDIFTTGSTMEACGRVLKEAGAASITGLVLASDH